MAQQKRRRRCCARFRHGDRVCVQRPQTPCAGPARASARCRRRLPGCPSGLGRRVRVGGPRGRAERSERCEGGRRPRRRRRRTVQYRFPNAAERPAGHRRPAQGAAHCVKRGRPPLHRRTHRAESQEDRLLELGDETAADEAIGLRGARRVAGRRRLWRPGRGPVLRRGRRCADSRRDEDSRTLRRRRGPARHQTSLESIGRGRGGLRRPRPGDPPGAETVP
mmetsp:Transcript_1624/g.3691  ORF Transcript_1624/g.3691 Transcript_1624/m.3691 type:complete len:222 (+) Transcript_1624:439-1104(+)